MVNDVDSDCGHRSYHREFYRMDRSYAPASWAVRIVIGLIVVGSASYLVGLFGLS